MNKKHWIPTLMTLSFLCLLVLPARAFQECQEDKEKFCSQSLGDRKAMKDCLRAHQDLLSPSCQEAIQSHRNRREAAKQACLTDREKLCPGLNSKEEIRSCIMAHRGQLSPECRRYNGKRMGHHRGQACRADVEKFCSDVKGDRKQMRTCLEKNQDQLSSKCQGIMERAALRKEVRRACRSDREKFCGDIQGGGGRIRDCMKSHEAKLSEACQAAIQKVKQKRFPKKSHWEAIRSASL